MVMHPARRAGLEGAVLDAEGALGHVALEADSDRPAPLGLGLRLGLGLYLGLSLARAICLGLDLVLGLGEMGTISIRMGI